MTWFLFVLNLSRGIWNRYTPVDCSFYSPVYSKIFLKKFQRLTYFAISKFHSFVKTLCYGWSKELIVISDINHQEDCCILTLTPLIGSEDIVRRFIEPSVSLFVHLFFLYKQSIFDPRPNNCLSFSKKSPQKIV